MVFMTTRLILSISESHRIQEALEDLGNCMSNVEEIIKQLRPVAVELEPFRSELRDTVRNLTTQIEMVSVSEFDGPRERIYVSADDLVITISFDDLSGKRTLPNEWVYSLKRHDLEDAKHEGDTLILCTKDGQRVKLTLFNADVAFEEIKKWIGLEARR